MRSLAVVPVILRFYGAPYIHERFPLLLQVHCVTRNVQTFESRVAHRIPLRDSRRRFAFDKTIAVAAVALAFTTAVTRHVLQHVRSADRVGIHSAHHFDRSSRFAGLRQRGPGPVPRRVARTVVDRNDVRIRALATRNTGVVLHARLPVRIARARSYRHLSDDHRGANNPQCESQPPPTKLPTL